MTEQNRDYNSDDEGTFGEVIYGEFGDRVALIERLDACRNELAYQLTEAATQLDNDPDGHGTLEIDVSQHHDAFKLLLRDILDDEQDTADAVEYAVELFAVESIARIELMKNILNQDVSTQLSPEIIMHKIGTCAAESSNFETMLEEIADFYEEDLRHDVDAFMRALLTAHHRHVDDGEDEETSTIELKKEAKDHVMDVAKIAIGVTIALAVEKLFRRKN